MRNKILIILLSIAITPLFSNNAKLKYLTIEDGLSNNYIVSITQDKKGFVWIATESGLNRFDGKNFKHYKKRRDRQQSSISGNELNKLYYDEVDNVLWIATQREGLNAFNCSTETFQEFKHSEDTTSIIGDDITHITGASNGNLWVSSYYNGVDHYDKRTKKFTHYNQSTLPTLLSNKVWIVEEDKINNLLFIGHVDKGLSVISLKTNTVQTFVHHPADDSSLPGNNVRSILIDKNNYVWIGTNNGLALYNPIKENFINFKHNPNQNNSLAGNLIFSIKELDDKRLFIATEGGGVSILDPQVNMFLSPDSVNFIHIKASDENNGLNNPTVRDIFQDTFGNIWLGTYGDGINLITHSPLHFNSWKYSSVINKKDKLNNKVAWGICADNNDNLWIGTDGGGINYFENNVVKKRITKENSNLVDNAILAAMKDSKGKLWFGTYQKGINIYDAKKNELTKFNLSNTSDIRCFYEDQDSNILIGSSHGLYIYNPNTKETKNYTINNSPLLDNLIRSISQDKEENFWIGTFGRGLFVLNKKMELIKHFNSNNYFYSNTINHIFRDSYNQMWVATGEGIVYFSNTSDLSTYVVLTEKEGLLNNHIRAIAEDLSHNIWISTNNGISRLSKANNRIFNYNHSHSAGIPIGNFMSGSVTKTSDGTLYFGSQNGVCFFNPELIPTELAMTPVSITEITVYNTNHESGDNNETLPVQKQIKLPHHKNTFRVTFNNLNVAQNPISEYAYLLEGVNDLWINTRGENHVTFQDLSHGKYELKFKSRLLNQDWSEEIASIQFIILPPFWLTWWAKSFYLILIISIILLIIFFYKRKLDLENTLILEKKNHIQEQYVNNERLRFFTNITHELRTPLTLILGPLDDMLNDKDLSPKQRIRINRIKDSGNRLFELINQLLEFRKIESENRKLQISKEDIATLIGDIGVKYKELNINKNLNINTHIETKESILFFDPEIITIILDNLISNAIKHTKRGSITITLRDYTENNKTYIEIEVNDTGKGIPKEFHAKIFERYFQIDEDKKISGTGIGLSLVKNLTNIHEGEITLNSSVSKGTSFFFRIEKNNTYPHAIHKKESDSSQNEVEIEKRSNEFVVKPTVLVVEDHEEIRLYIKESLADYYDILATDNGKKGYELAIEHTPDLIISDIMMPIMDGIELCKKVKKDIRTSHIPIILLTAKDSAEDRTEGYDMGADSYIVKPFNTQLLHSRISNILNSRKEIAALVRNNTAVKTEIMTESISQMDQEFLQELTKIIEENIDSDNLTVGFIAEKMNMSHSTLYRKVKALTDMTVNEFIRKVKMKKAEQLLLEGRYNISEVSYILGINSVTYFRQCFKDEFGLPPSEYIKHFLDKDNKKEG